ncbi:MAG: GyrI-like domain-containing protein, partial [Anaerolineae bacterium]|nr:GyrI-like domain-containing protein [Anaerolineae bacterium]
PSAKKFEILDVPPANFLMIDGTGDPNTAAEYTQAVEALYSLSYTLKFAIKKQQEIDYPVMALEGLWWADDMTAFTAGDRDRWLWMMMIMQPDFVTVEQVEAARAEAAKKKDLPALPKIRYEPFHEGLSVQIMHIGPYSAEAPTIARMHAFIEESGHVPTGKHHEIYLGDPRRTAPEKLKTVLRQPIKPKS